MVYDIFTFGPPMVHAGLMICQCILAGNSQYRDIVDISLPTLPHEPKVRDLLGVALANGHSLRQLLRAAVSMRLTLLVLGCIPLPLYIIALFLKAGSQAFNVQVDIGRVALIVALSAAFVQIVYLVVKVCCRFSALLIDLHPRYKGATPIGVLLDIVPVLKRAND